MQKVNLRAHVRGIGVCPDGRVYTYVRAHFLEIINVGEIPLPKIMGKNSRNSNFRKLEILEKLFCGPYGVPNPKMALRVKLKNAIVWI